MTSVSFSDGYLLGEEVSIRPTDGYVSLKVGPVSLKDEYVSLKNEYVSLEYGYLSLEYGNVCLEYGYLSVEYGYLSMLERPTKSLGLCKARKKDRFVLSCAVGIHPTKCMFCVSPVNIGVKGS